MLAFLSLMAGTLVSEDLSCIAAGLLIRRGDIGVATAVGACSVGIFAGDIGLWIAGRVCGRSVLGWPAVRLRLQSDRFRVIRSWLDQHAGRAILASRLLPGTRLPLYVVAGFVGLSPWLFVRWALVGTLVWTPTLVLLTAHLGDAFVARMSRMVGPGWVADMVLASLMLLLLHAARTNRWGLSQPAGGLDHGRAD